MTLVRAYLSLTPEHLEQLIAVRSLDPAGIPTFAVTEALRAQHSSEDPEGLEFLAMQDAAAATDPGQRVLVAAIDVPEEALDAGIGDAPSTATLDGDVELSRVVSLHLGDAGLVPSADVETELSWYDISEIHQVRELVDRG